MRIFKSAGLAASVLLAAGLSVPASVANASVDVSSMGSLAPAPAPAPAHAPEGGSRLVVLGDSYASGTNLMTYPDSRDCMQSVTAWPKDLAGRLGIRDTADFVDTSCSGGAIDTGDGWLLADQARFADDLGALGPRTEAVLLQFGMNDAWVNSVNGHLVPMDKCIANLIDGCDRGVAAGNRAQDVRATTPENYANRIRQVVTYIKYYAPNAKIALVGHPEMTPQRGDEICGTFLGLPVVQPRGGAVVDFFAALDDAMRGAARILDIGFVDVRGPFSGHGPCSADPWVSGLFDIDNPFAGPLHPNRRGDAVIAGLVRDALGL